MPIRIEPGEQENKLQIKVNATLSHFCSVYFPSTYAFLDIYWFTYLFYYYKYFTNDCRCLFLCHIFMLFMILGRKLLKLSSICFVSILSDNLWFDDLWWYCSIQVFHNNEMKNSLFYSVNVLCSVPLTTTTENKIDFSAFEVDFLLIVFTAIDLSNLTAISSSTHIQSTNFVARIKRVSRLPLRSIHDCHWEDNKNKKMGRKEWIACAMCNDHEFVFTWNIGPSPR